ncbi:hypothetical protein [Nocardia sp. AG03]|uniref:hypothetical protein n=1 Tax=Nocardia sp. AG03 TaxID=3025312 RepID=UPI0024184CBD|nr:hypothetical protein [Nocardia sp. AG03]
MKLEPESVDAFLSRFFFFEDGSIVGVSLELQPATEVRVIITIDAMESSRTAIADSVSATGDIVWRKVRMTIEGVSAYRFLASERFTYNTLSDGIQLAVGPNECVLDLNPAIGDDWSPTTPGSGSWSAQQVFSAIDSDGINGECTRQFVVGKSISIEVSSI